MSKKSDSHGEVLHREFVGMLFALAIAEVAIEGAGVVNSGVVASVAFPAYSHLFLAIMVIAASWVGWGWSDHSLSNVRNVFTNDFIELLLDVWLVILYFFIVRGAELPVLVNGQQTIIPSSANEAFWIMVVFLTYLVWDVWTKWGKNDDHQRNALVQRGWASVSCAILSFVCYRYLSAVQGVWRVVVVDVLLLTLVFLFRAMKLHNLSDMPAKHRGWIAVVVALWLVSAGAITRL